MGVSTQVNTPFTGLGRAKVQAPCTPAVGQIAVQPPLLPGSLLLPEAVQLQPHGQCQMQEGDKPQQLVASASPLVLSRQTASTELLRQVTLAIRIPQDLASLLLAGGFMFSQASSWPLVVSREQEPTGRWV